MADESTKLYFLVQWEDRFMSVIEPKCVVTPKKSAEDYEEGEFIVATYQTKAYEAVISEIHHDRKFLLKQAKLLPKYAFQTTTDRKTTTKEQSGHTPSTEPHEDLPLPRHLPSVALKENPVIDDPAKQKTCNKSDHDTSVTQPHEDVHVRCLMPTNAFGENHLIDDATETSATSGDDSKGSSMEPCVQIHLSQKRSLEKRIEKLEAEVKLLKRNMKKPRLELEEPTSSGPDQQITDLLKSVDHMSSGTEKGVNECLKKLCFSIFSCDELVNCSRTGKKTIHSPEARARPALDKSKMEMLEKVVLKKCPSLQSDILKKKIDNIIKTTRRDFKKK